MTPFEISYSRLNAEQKRAVDTTSGPVMVVAGPGTGKTQMLALRIANILKKEDVSAENILCLTFTEAGVKAMRQRLKELLGKDAFKVDVYTFHGFANDVIQKNPESFRFSSDAIQLDELQKLKLIQDIIERLSEPAKEQKLIPFYDKFAKQKQIISAIQTLKKEGIGVEELLLRAKEALDEHNANVVEHRGKPTVAWTKKKEKLEALLELYDIYKLYQQELQKKEAYDYEDMILFVVNEFRNNSTLLAEYQEQYLYIHVDEYQDTNGSQNELLELLGSNQDGKPNIFVVGDDDQAIFRFQGANIDNILEFNTKFTDINIIATVVNYRSTQMILNVAESLINNNQNRLSKLIPAVTKVLKSHNDSKYKDRIEVHEFNNSTDENVFVAKEILRLHQNESVEFNEIAVLYRNNSDVIDILDAFKKYSIPVQLQKSDNIWEGEYITKFIEILKAISLYEKFENELLYSILLFDFVNLEASFVYRLAKFAQKRKLDYLDIFASEINFKEFTTLLPANLKQDSIKSQNFINNLLKFHQLEKNTSFVRFIEVTLNETGILDFLFKKEDIESINSFTKLFEYILSNCAFDKNYDLRSFLRDVELALNNNVSLSISKVQSKEPSVFLSTVHGSKGLEFEHVFLIKASDSNWGKVRATQALVPTELYSLKADSTSKENLLEDERRLFFVGITRAKKHVIITHSAEYSKNGYVSASIHSRFIDEITDALKEIVEHPKSIDITDSAKLLSQTPAKDFSKLTKEYLISQVSDFKLSPSTLNAYLASPKDFMYRYLLNMPHTKSKEEALGISVHKSLEYFNQGLIKQNNVTKEEIIEAFSKTIYKEYSDFEDYEDTKQEGIRLLDAYFDFALNKETSSAIAEAEYNFSSHNVMFDIPNSDPIQLTGRIDAIKFVGSDTNSVKVIDYKTSKFKTVREIKGDTKNSTGNEFRQLTFYKLISELDSNFRPAKSLSKPKYIVETGEICFIKPYKKGEYRTTEIPITNEDVANLKNLITEVVNRIRNLEFPEECDLAKK